MVGTAAIPNTAIVSLLGQAHALERGDRFAQAAYAYEQVLALDRRNLEALAGLGALALRRGETDAGLRYLEAAWKQRRGDGQLNYNIAVAHLQARRPDRALEFAERALAARPNDLATLRMMYELQTNLARPAVARRHIEKALALQPDDPDLLLCLAQAYDTGGEPEKARAAYRTLLDRGGAAALAYYGHAQLVTFTSEPPELAEIEARLAAPDLDDRDRAILHRATAKIVDDLGRHDVAFAEHTAANRATGRAREHDVDFAAQVERMRAAFTPEFFTTRAAMANPSRRPVFVFGMPRSGTTLVEQILASHPKIRGAGELTFFGDEARKHAQTPLDVVGAQRMGREYLKLLSSYGATAERVVDKMPHNFERLWLLALLFPNATFIHCRRDPVANCVSCYTQNLGQVHFYTADLGTLGRYYRQYEALMEVWRQALPVKILDVQYEDLVDDPEAMTRRIIAHAGMPWHDACLRFYETRRSVRTPSRRQVEQPIYRSGLTAWRRFEPYLGPLFEALGTAPAKV